MVQVIFLENIEDNKVGDVKNVPDGYARNFLFPRGVAEVATDEKLKELESKISKIKKEEGENVKLAKELAKKLKDKKIVMIEEVNDDGKLFGSVTNREIAEKLEELKFNIEPANIEIESQIKELGDHEINIKVGHGVETKVTITVDRKD